ncbi:MAG: hypothetical protein ACXWJD_07475 [Burkholderiaceae bacterium]
MHKMLRMCLICSFLFFPLMGYAAKQEITKFAEAVPQTLCVARNAAVKEGVLEAIQEGFTSHGTTVKLVDATYTEEHAMLHPTLQRDQLTGCDAVVFYVANWHWDLALYMRFANIWITNRNMSRKLAQATYQAGFGPGKFIDAKKKILELVDGLVEGMPVRPLTELEQGPTTTQSTIEPQEPRIVVPGIDKLTFDPPDGFEVKPLTEAQKNTDIVFHALNRAADIGVFVSADSHSGIKDMMSYAMTKRANQEGRLADAKSTDIMQITVAGRPAYRFEVSGNLKTGRKSAISYMLTIIEGSDQIIIVNEWTGSANFSQRRSEMEDLATHVNGIL